MPRPTSNGPNLRPDGRDCPPEEYSETLGWTGSYTAYSWAVENGGITADDILLGWYPDDLVSILAFEV